MRNESDNILIKGFSGAYNSQQQLSDIKRQERHWALLPFYYADRGISRFLLLGHEPTVHKNILSLKYTICIFLKE